ncbi:hypothetical protein AB0H42_26640 [Nocardia sp. NPDC050799]|uniref:hypothetical protein n=1 Tax=Nocardia sp. NPDC050799 TaxID=3154842 RepID=UPI0033C36D2C
MSGPLNDSPPTDTTLDTTDHAAPFTARERWALAAAAAWVVTGLQVDSFAHSTVPDLETFWTPWHAVLYSGIACCGLVLFWLLRPRLPQTLTYRILLHETPPALRLPVVGMAFLLVGGAIDTLWHNLFGIEKGLEIFFSPSHFLIVIGMALVASGPALMLAASLVRRLAGGDAVLVLISAALTAIPMHIYTEHAGALEEPLLGTGDSPMKSFSLDAQMMHGYVGSTVLLLLPILVLARRWSLPAGMPTALVMIPALAVGLVLGEAQNPWLPATVAVATALTEVAARTAAPALRRYSPDTRWSALGFLAPIAVWGAVLTLGHVIAGVQWPLHMVTGLLTLVALTGLGTAFVVRRVTLVPDPAR